MVVSISTFIRKVLMICTQIERLKRDKKEALYYRKRLIKRGKDTLAYKMQRKIEYLSKHIDQMESLRR